MPACGDGDQTSASASETDSDSQSTSQTDSETESAGPTTDGTESESDSEAGTATQTEAGSDTDSDSETTDSDTTDSDTDSETDSDTTDSESESDSDTTDTGLDPASCLDADLPYEGSLCGPEQDPCVVLVNESVDPEPSFRNDSPAIALDAQCQPNILYSVAVGGYHGFFARRTGDNAWETEPTPMEVATCGLATDPDQDIAYAQVDDGAFGVSIWQRVDDQWSELASQNSMNHSRAQGFGRDTSGKLHSAFWSADGGAKLGDYVNSWEVSPTQGTAAQDVALGVDELNSGGHLTYWTSAEGTWELYWEMPPEGPELIAPLGLNSLEVREQALTVIPPEGLDLPTQPWVLLATRTAPQNHHKIVLASREGAQDWNLREVAAEDPDTDQNCYGDPNGPDDTCNYDYTRYLPLEIVSSHGGDVRFMYLQTRYTGELFSECVDMPFPMCWWVQGEDTSTSELRVGWPTDNGIAEAVVAENVFPTRLTAVVDSVGRVHMAMYERAPGLGDPTVRYLAFGSVD